MTTYNQGDAELIARLRYWTALGGEAPCPLMLQAATRLEALQSTGMREALEECRLIVANLPHGEDLLLAKIDAALASTPAEPDGVKKPTAAMERARQEYARLKGGDDIDHDAFEAALAHLEPATPADEPTEAMVEALAILNDSSKPTPDRVRND